MNFLLQFENASAARRGRLIGYSSYNLETAAL